MENNEKKNEPNVIRISNGVIIAVIVGTVLIVSMLTGTFPIIAALIFGAVLGYMTPTNVTNQLDDIKDFLKQDDNYYTYKETKMPDVNTKPDMPNAVAPKAVDEKKEEPKNDNK
jgi:uncharacterized protein YacL